MTRRASTLDAIEPAPTAPFNVGDMERFGLEAGDLVRIETRRGTIEITARPTCGIPEGVVFVPFAYVEAAANLLTNPVLDPFGKIPEFKFCAAKIEPVGMTAAAE